MRWRDSQATWPNADHSEFIQTNNVKWHVQHWGLRNKGNASSKHKTTILLLHGTGASTHSWRALAPLLAKHHNVLNVDLPGHAFTSKPPRRWMTLEGMATGLGELLETLNVKPDYIVGHSAGAAIAIQMALMNLVSLKKIFSFNGALLPLESLSGQLFSPIAKLLVLNPLVPRLFSWRANSPSVVDALLESTGSKLDVIGNALYAQLIQNHEHAAGALAMMASWDLESLKRELPKLQTPLALVAAANDKTILPSVAHRVKVLLPQAQIITMKGLGHLAHEEDPEQALSIISTNL
jgi:magnesium chelatase accessory protein